MNKRFLLLFLCFPLISMAQHSVSGTFSPPENYKWGILYEVTPTGTRYTADTKVDEEGNFSMPLDSTVSAGVYRFVYGVPPESNNFEFIYSAEESIELTFSEEKGLTFVTSDENKRWSSFLEVMDVLQAGIDSEFENENPNQVVLDSLFEKQESIFYLYKNSSRGKMVANFIASSSPFIPENELDASSYYKEKNKHLLNTLRYEDTILQRSGYLMERTLRYIQESPFPYEKYLDGIAQNLMPCSNEFQKGFMVELWQHLQESKRSDEANYLASAYLIPLALRLKDKPMARELEITVNTSVGAKAPNFSWTDMADNTRSLHELNNAENYILVFWSSTCSHCLSELPKLEKEVRFLPKNKYLVVAFGLEDDIYSWKNEILRLPDFLHIPGLGKWQNETGNAYGISKTPTYFVLDSEKVIRAKPETLEDLLDIIKSL